MPSNSWYRVEWSSLAIGKVIASSKRKLVFKFGFVNADAISAGLTGAACRGEEHEIVVGFSLSSGKRAVTYDKKVVYYTEGRSMQEGKFEHSWTIQGGHNVRISAHFSQPYGKRQYDMFVDGESFFTMPHIFELGTNLKEQRMKRLTNDVSTDQKDTTSGNGLDDIPKSDRSYSSFEGISTSKQSEPSTQASNGTGSESCIPLSDENPILIPFDLLDFDLETSPTGTDINAPPIAQTHMHEQQLSFFSGPEQYSPNVSRGGQNIRQSYMYGQSNTNHVAAEVGTVNPFVPYLDNRNVSSVASSHALTISTDNHYWNAGYSQATHQHYKAPNDEPMSYNSHVGINSMNPHVFQSHHPSQYQNHQTNVGTQQAVGGFGHGLPQPQSFNYPNHASALVTNPVIKGYEPHLSPTSTTAVDTVQEIASEHIQALQMNDLDDKLNSIVNLDDLTAPFETPEQRRRREQKEETKKSIQSNVDTVGYNAQNRQIMRTHQPPHYTGGVSYAPQHSLSEGYSTGTSNSTIFQHQYQQNYY